MATFRDLLARTKAQITEVDTAEAERRIAAGDLVLDVREPDEYEEGAIPGAVHIPRGHLESQVEGRLLDKTKPVVIYCAGGVRSAFAAETLNELGYADVVSMAGGFGRWKDEGRAWRKPAALTPAQANRYKRHLPLLNPDVNVVTYDTRLDASNIIDIITGYDVIVDGADNFPSRYLLNDASVKLGIPVVHGSIFRFEGMVSVFDPKHGPTYRDMVPEPPPAELAPSCSEAGVLGVLPGIVGSIQAIETIKLLLDLGDPLIGRLLAYDALDETFRTFKVRRDPECPACGPNAAPIVIAEYDQQCLPHAVLADGSVLTH